MYLTSEDISWGGMQSSFHVSNICKRATLIRMCVCLQRLKLHVQNSEVMHWSRLLSQPVNLPDGLKQISIHSASGLFCSTEIIILAFRMVHIYSDHNDNEMFLEHTIWNRSFIILAQCPWLWQACVWMKRERIAFHIAKSLGNIILCAQCSSYWVPLGSHRQL